jgi:hypothetical protein
MPDWRLEEPTTLARATPAATLLRSQTVRGHAIDAFRTIALLLVVTLAILVLLPAALAAQVASAR